MSKSELDVANFLIQIAESNNEIELDQNLAQLASAVCSQGTAIAIIVWGISEEGRPRVVLERGLDKFSNEGAFHVGPEHLELVHQAFSKDELVEREQQPTDGPNSAFAQQLIRLGDRNFDRVINLLSADSDSTNFATELMEEFRSSRAEQRKGEQSIQIPSIELQSFSEFLASIHEQISVKKVGQVAATDGRVLVGCDRLSILLFRGKSSRIIAISHVQTIQKRGSLARAMRSLANKSRNLPSH